MYFYIYNKHNKNKHDVTCEYKCDMIIIFIRTRYRRAKRSRYQLLPYNSKPGVTIFLRDLFCFMLSLYTSFSLAFAEDFFG